MPALDPYSIAAGQQLSAQLAKNNGIAPPPGAWLAFAAQASNETAGGNPQSRGVLNNNPFNLTTAGGTITWPGQVGSDGPFAVFATKDAGIAAAAQNYQAPAYGSVIGAYQLGDPLGIARAIEGSPWAAGGYGGSLSSAVASSLSLGPAAANPVPPQVPTTSPAAAGLPPLAARLTGSGLASTPLVGGLVQIGTKAVVTLAVIVLMFIGVMKIAAADPKTQAKKIAGRAA